MTRAFDYGQPLLMPLPMATRVAIDDGLIAGQSIRGISGR